MRAGADKRESRLLLAAALTTATMLAEAIGGVVSGSLALLADAGHMLVDSSALVLAWLGARFARRPPDARRSFGYGRLEVLAGFVNALTMFVLVAWIVWEAIERIRQPAPILSGVMLVVALIGLAVNVFVLTVLGGHHHGHDHTHGHDHGDHADPGAAGRPAEADLNIQGARLHVIGDLLASVAAVAAALVVRYTGWTVADPLLSLLVSALILVNAWRLLRRTGHILLEGVPEGVDTTVMRGELLASHPAVADVHHIHAWSLGGGLRVATLHLRLHDPLQGEAAQVALRSLLQRRYHIDHVTIQVENEPCPDPACSP